MRNYVLMLLIVLAGVFTANAKEPHKGDGKLFDSKVLEISQQLDLNEQQIAQFKPIYKQYQDEVHKVKRPLRCDDSKALTSDQAYKAVVSQIKYKEGILHVQEKYMAKFKNILTPQQLLRLPGVEFSIQRKIRDAKIKRCCGREQRRERK